MLGLKSIGYDGGAPKNALTLSSMTPAMRDVARSHRLTEFPVSSGNAHRIKEADITLEEDISKIPTGLVAAQRALTSLVNTDDPVLKMIKFEPPPGTIKLPPLPDQLIQVPIFLSPSLSCPTHPSIKMGGMDRCGILFYAGSTTTDIGLQLVAPAPRCRFCQLSIFAFKYAGNLSFMEYTRHPPPRHQNNGIKCTIF
jgi:hypothetical protein